MIERPWFVEDQWRRGDEPHRIARSAIIDGSVILGHDVLIHPHVVIYPHVVIGDGVEVFAGSVIGRPPRTAGIVPPKEYMPATEIGAGSVVGASVTIYAGVQIGENTLIGDGVRIRENTTVGDASVVGSNSTLQNDVRIGRRVRIVDLSHVTAGVTIEDDVFWSVGVLSMNDNRDGGGLQRMRVGERAFIGGGALLLPGSDVGVAAIVAAGSVVTHPVPDYQQVRGIPARHWSARPRMAHDLGYDGTPGPVVREE